MLKKERLVSLQHSGFKYEPWSPVAFVHTPTPPLTSSESLSKPYFTSSESLSKPYFTYLRNSFQTSVHLMELQKNE